MFIFFFTIITLSLGVSIISARSPIVLGFWILILSILASVLCSSIFFRWFGFIIFLIYIGGMLVMFSYFVAIQPNQRINIITPSFYFFLAFSNLPINICPAVIDLFNLNNWWITSMFYVSNISILVILGFILFLALVSVVKITIINVAPLRPFLKYV